jgi:23S rRNA (uracil1939-C5)-methyltransferase
VYSHIAYPRQLLLKSDVVRDAFLRLGRMPIDAAIPVAPSPERGYRMRARFHVEGTRIGFYREGTHALCDAMPSGQIGESAYQSVLAAVAALAGDSARLSSVELTESVDGSQRALAIGVDDVRRVGEETLAQLPLASGLMGCVVEDPSGAQRVSGEASVTDPLVALTRGRVSQGTLRRHARSFFQANRYLVPDLVNAVLDAIPADAPAVDLYAGVGLFSIALAGSGRRDVTAVESDSTSGRDLLDNAVPYLGAVTVLLHSVEHYLETTSVRADTIVVDPPRTGMSAEATSAIVKTNVPRIVYVSCDPATMARDARRLLDGGYRLDSLRAFDLFPNTPHVETCGVFIR